MRDLTHIEAFLLTTLIEQCEVDVARESVSPIWTFFDGVAPDLDLPSFSLDSLAALELIVCVEGEYEISLEDAPSNAWFTLETLGKYIENCIGKVDA